MKKLKALNILLPIFAIILVVGVAAGGTVAVLKISTDRLQNTFGIAYVDVTVNEKTETGTNPPVTGETTTREDETTRNVGLISVKRDVCVSNTGETTTYVRVRLVASWVNEYGEVSAESVSVDDCQVTWGNNGAATLGESDSRWFLAQDGCYYYSEPLTSGAVSDILIKECVPGSAGPEGCNLDLNVMSECIQSLPAAAVESAWPAVTVGEGGSLTEVS